jgi:hypothetical protein
MSERTRPEASGVKSLLRVCGSDTSYFLVYVFLHTWLFEDQGRGDVQRGAVTNFGDRGSHKLEHVTHPRVYENAGSNAYRLELADYPTADESHE